MTSDSRSSNFTFMRASSNKLRPWVQVVLATLAISGALAWTGALGRLDRILYDVLLATDTHAPVPDIVLIGIDAQSVAELGPLPWPGGVYALGLKRLSSVGTRAVAIDLPLQRDDARAADTPTLSAGARAAAGAYADVAAGGDDVLADAIKTGGRIVIAADAASITPSKFTDSGAIEGRSGFVPDSDGVVRRVTLVAPVILAGRAPVEREHLMVALARAGGFDPAVGATRKPERRLPFSGVLGKQRYFSYAALIKGEIPSADLRQKLVIVGPGDALGPARFTVPSWFPQTDPNSRSQVEMDGALASALIGGSAISNLDGATAVLATLTLVFIAACTLWMVPQRGPTVIGVLAAATVVLSIVLLRYERWFPPASALAGIALVYPLLRWRWLEASALTLTAVFDGILREPAILAETGATERTPERQALLRNQIDAALAIAARTRSLRRFLITAFEDLPYATLLASSDGHIVFANRHARAFFGALNQTQIDGAQLPYLLATLTPDAAVKDFSWWNMIELQRRQSKVAAADSLGRAVDITCTSCPGADGDVIGWLVTLTDISAVHVANRRREEALHFISHDLSSQQASILSAVTGAEGDADGVRIKVEQHARRTLTLADRFVQLSLAESQPLDFTVYNISDLVDEAIAENEAAARLREVTIVFQRPAAAVLAEVDTDMLARAFGNLLSNAIRFASAGGSAEIRIDEISALGEVTISFIDDGQGIAPLEQVRMLRILQRILVPGSSQQGGVGLGLSLARVVAEKHRGRLEFTSSPGVGTEFRVVLPRGLDLAATHHASASTTPL